MMAKLIGEADETGPQSLTMLLNAHELKLYMTRPALEELAANLLRISQAPPEECYEIHVSMNFSRFDDQDRYISPKIRFAHGLGPIIEEIRSQDLAAARREAPDVGGLSPFELTIMHVSPEAVGEEALRNDDET